MRVALVEIDTAWEDPAANRERIAAALPAPGTADLAVLPEMVFSGFTMDPAPHPEVEEFLAAEARRRRLALIAGYVGAGPRNVAAAFDGRGARRARYAKLHPFSYAGEERHYVRGDELPVFALGGFRAAMLICYDLRFPEAFRDAALRGAELLVVIANWPAARAGHWRTLLRARAIENQAYVVGVNRAGRDPHQEYGGGSLAIGPRGEVLHEGGGVVRLDREAVVAWRAEFPALRDVRTDRYRLAPPS